MRPIHALTGLLIGLAAGAPAASAAEYCVQCEEPAAAYRCTVVPQEHLPSPQAQQMYCLTELAKQGGHERCSLRRRVEAPCEGLPRSLLMQADDGWTPPPGTPTPTPPAGQAKPGDAAESAGTGLKKAGEAVGSAAKKSWDCVTSLFKRC